MLREAGMTAAPDTDPRSETARPGAERRERTFSWVGPVAIARAAAGVSGAESFTSFTEGKISRGR
jgi:hypothetical protein